jgi:tetratricopeptide (TPR) repeat protein
MEWFSVCYVFGPMPVSEAIERATEIQARAHGAVVEADVLAMIGGLTAMQGDVDRGWSLMRGARQTLRDAGLFVTAEAYALMEASVALRAGNHEASERVLREGLAELERLGDQASATTTALTLADCLYSQGRLDEVEPLCLWARERTNADDLVNFVFLAGLEGLLLARRGHREEAEQSARRAVELGETTDFFDARAWPRLVLAETLALAGRTDEAAESGAQALAIHEAKGDVTGAARARERLAEAGVPVG